MEINIFLLCFNEYALLPHTISHYKKYLPSCRITIYDNESTDHSVEIAKSLGCSVISWSSNNHIDDFKIKEIKNNCWKSVKKGWIIVADMDEFLCVTENELLNEMNKGTTVLQVKGYDMIGESNTIDLSDIDLQEIKKYVDNHYVSKKLCFLRDKIKDINYDCGAHSCNPNGKIVYSSNIYLNKHMCMLGLDFFVNKNINRFWRAEQMRKYQMATHYTDNIENIHQIYKKKLEVCKLID